MSQDSPFRVRTAPPRRPLAHDFAENGYVRAPDFLEDLTAQAISNLLPDLPYVLVASDVDGATLVINDAVVARFGEAGVRGLLRDTLAHAARGFAFIHQSYPLQDEYDRTPSHPVNRITDFLQSRAFLDVGAEILGRPVGGVRVQVSRYRKGDFLTLHDDSHTRDRRLAAFTLGMTRGWRPDWGGQLLFHDEAGDITHGFAPGFNILTVFKVPRLHSVAPVAAYAAQPRLSLTGWFIEA